MKPSEMTDHKLWETVEKMRTDAHPLCNCGINGCKCKHRWHYHWPDGVITECTPYYTPSLDTIHEAVNSLPTYQYELFDTELWNLCKGDSRKTWAVNATARQRAEAFVTVMSKIEETI